MAGVKVTPAQATEKWVTRLSAAGPDTVAGINRVTEAPGLKAAAKKAKWMAAIQASQEKWATNVAAVSLESWKKTFLDVGVQRIAQGAQAKKGKYTAFAADFYPHLERGVQRVASMPDTTFEDRINKAVTMMRHNHDFKRSATRA